MKSDFWRQNQSNFSVSSLEWLDSSLGQICRDLNYSMKIQPGTSWESSRLDCVLDPAAQGGAHTGSVFGSSGISVSPDSIYNRAYEIPQFWWYILTMHETVNVVTGSMASSWIWADGSPLWSGGSPFPNMCDIVVSREIGRRDVSAAQLSRMGGDPGVRLFLDVQQQYGWGVFQRLFEFARNNGIRDWAAYSEPLRTAIIVWFLSYGANLTTFSTQHVLLERFNSSLRKISGIEVPPSIYTQAQALFPRPDVPHLL